MVQMRSWQRARLAQVGLVMGRRLGELRRIVIQVQKGEKEAQAGQRREMVDGDLRW